MAERIQNCALIATKKSGLETTSGPMETRDYELNSEKAMKKKLYATTRDHAIVKVTGGGLKIEFSTGMYELFKCCADEFYQSETLKFKCQKTPVYDNIGSLVETKYRLSSGRNGVYTINLYHTKCSCLVNGKMVNQFAESDLLEIIQLTSNKLISENLTVDEVNAKFQEILQECMLVLTNKQTEEKDVCCLRPEINDFNFMVNTKQPEHFESVLKVQHVKIDASTKTESTGIEFDFETLFCLIQTIQKSVSDMRKDVCEHSLNTNRGFNELKDIIHSVKVISTTNSRGTDDKCDCLQENVQYLKQTLDQLNISVQKKFQSLGDILKANSLPSVLSKGYRNGSVEATSKRMSEDSVENDTLLETEQMTLEPSPQAISDIQESTVHFEEETNKGEHRSNITPQTSKTLLIGDSILRGINKRGLCESVDICTLPGKTMLDICEKLRKMNISDLSKIIIFAGGNDVSNGQQISIIKDVILQTSQCIQDQTNCEIFICKISPRRDVDVRDFNSMLEDVSSELPVKLIDCYNCFVYGNGQLANRLFRPDGIHPSNYGSSSLVAAINEVVHITKKRMQQQQQQHRQLDQNQRRRTSNGDFKNGHREYRSAKPNFQYGLHGFRNGHRDFRNGYHDFRKGHHDFRNGHHNFFRQHDLRNAHLDTRSEYQDCHNENRDFRYVRRHVNHENSRHCTNCGRQNHVTRDCRLPKRQ
ncbi:hypothetical protein DPMN_164625 [Dreissena polymorpha]|uniref:CCHC-type domain-containing protein n=1 Tax=Dreissena polymorpha TaxID=45954 RepID=A0A9D4EVG5_DREPO|nr:hypothetical protein DPMN_164625 [Dreissena polymorpha]